LNVKMMKRLNTEKLHALLTARNSDDAAAGRVGGSCLCVHQDGELCYEGFFGTDPAFGAPITETTIFRMASMTKPVTAVAALILHDEGKLDLNAPISRWLPDFAEQNIVDPDENGNLKVVGQAKTPITAVHLLTHTSGIGTGVVGNLQQRAMPANAAVSLQGITAYYARAGLAFEPFTRNDYSATAAFNVMGRLVEILSGQTYDDFLRERIFAPCGMCDTTFTPTDAQWQRMIPMHDYRDGIACPGKTTPGCVFEDCPCCSCQAGAGLISTLHDYSRFAGMLLHGGAINGQRILSQEAIDLMRHPYVTPDMMPGSGYSRGLGVRVVTNSADPALPVGTYGWSGAYGTHFWVDPVNRITAVYLKNSRYDGGAGCVTGVNFEKDVAAALV